MDYYASDLTQRGGSPSILAFSGLTPHQTVDDLKAKDPQSLSEAEKAVLAMAYAETSRSSTDAPKASRNRHKR